MYHSLSRMAEALARGVVLAGGAVLIALIVMTCISIIGRALVPIGLTPVKGDFEWIEIGIGFAIFAFLPWCQLKRGHAAVDLLQPVMGTGLNRVIDLVSDILMLAVAVLITWRLWLGMLDKFRFGETTFILQAPVWVTYAVCLVGAASFVLVATFCVIRSLRQLGGASDVKP